MLRLTIYSSLGGPSVSGTGRRWRTGIKPSSAGLADIRRGSTTSVLKDAKVSGLARIDKCSSEKLWRACAQ